MPTTPAHCSSKSAGPTQEPSPYPAQRAASFVFRAARRMGIPFISTSEGRRVGFAVTLWIGSRGLGSRVDIYIIFSPAAVNMRGRTAARMHFDWAPPDRHPLTGTLLLTQSKNSIAPPLYAALVCARPSHHRAIWFESIPLTLRQPGTSPPVGPAIYVRTGPTTGRDPVLSQGAKASTTHPPSVPGPNLSEVPTTAPPLPE